MEKRGDENGVNKNAFFVTNDLTTDWVELPDIKPSQLKAARNIRYVFTGNLNRIIITNPHFAGTEKEYLRCQIARISHGANIIPSTNHYKIADPDQPFRPLEKNDEAKPLKINELLNLKNWIHFLPGILKEGRISHYIEVPEGVDDPEDYRKKYIERDPFDKRIKPIGDDQNLLSSINNIKLPAWKIQYLYDDKVYTDPGIKLNPEEEEQKDNTKNFVLVCIKSLRWPGSYTVRFKNENYSFYFGLGQKFADYTLGEKFVYQSFPVLPKDVDDIEDYPEPNSPPPEENKQIDPDQNN